jgi:single-stranded DNA-binding protein
MVTRNYSNSNNLNKISLCGQITAKDTSISNIEGRNCFKFTLSIEEQRIRDGVERTNLDIFEINAFDDFATHVQENIKLNQKVIILGSVRYRSAPSKLCFIEAHNMSFDVVSDSPSLNDFMIIGRVGRAPEVREKRNNSISLVLSVCTSQYNITTKSSEKPDWHKVHVYGQKVESIKNVVDSGVQVVVQGKMRSIPVQNEQGKLDYDNRMVFMESSFVIPIFKTLDNPGEHEIETDEIPF